MGIYSLFITFNLDVLVQRIDIHFFDLTYRGKLFVLFYGKQSCVENATRHSFVLVPPADKAQTPFVSQPFHEFEKNCQNNQNSLSCVEKVLKTR